MPPATYCTPGTFRIARHRRTSSSPPIRARPRDRRAAGARSDDRASPSDRLRDGTPPSPHRPSSRSSGCRSDSRASPWWATASSLSVDLRPPVAGADGDLVEAGGAHLLLDRSLRAGADRHHRQHRGHTDGDAEHRQAGLQAIAAKRLDRDVDHGMRRRAFHVKALHPERAFRPQSGRNASRMGSGDRRRPGRP